jgi:hypothetical protein
MRLTRKIELITKPKNVYIPDDGDIQALVKLQESKTRQIWLEDHECNDFILDKNGTGVAKVKIVSVGAWAKHLVPGWNEVPGHVAEMLEENKKALKNATNTKLYERPAMWEVVDQLGRM